MNKKRPLYIFLFYILIITISFLIAIWIKPATIKYYLPHYFYPFCFFLVISLFISYFMGKFKVSELPKTSTYIVRILKSNFVILAAISIVMILFKEYQVSRFVFLFTFIFMTLLEIIISIFYFSFFRIGTLSDIAPNNQSSNHFQQTEARVQLTEDGHQKIIQGDDSSTSDEFFISEFGVDVYNFVSKFIDFKSQRNGFFSTTTRFNILKIRDNYYDSIINIKKVNNIRRINKFFEAVNAKLPIDGIFIGKVETNHQKSREILQRYKGFGFIALFFFFIFRRVLPKLKITQKLYFYFTNGKKRALSKAESLGRLASCGFEIIEYEEINNLLYFVGKKIKEPYYDLNPSYGPLFKMRRVGKDGKIIFVYKFRTMHPYAEYLQDYIIKMHGYSEIGKPANDFRLTRWGKFMRRLWLDELPQLINVLKGEMKLVGVRPISQRFLKEYPEDVLQLRLKQKPGCIPPYVALLKQDIKEYIESERIYLIEREKRPHITDVKYFFKAVYNILTNKIRSS